jgi:hypothetical protein
MQTVRLNDLCEPVRSFIEQASLGDGIIVADETGRARCGVVPYRQATAEEKRLADESLTRLRRKVDQAMTEQGVTEGDIDRALEEDD